jgi:hypothetical protein
VSIIFDDFRMIHSYAPKQEVIDPREPMCAASSQCLPSASIDANCTNLESNSGNLERRTICAAARSPTSCCRRERRAEEEPGAWGTRLNGSPATRERLENRKRPVFIFGNSLGKPIPACANLFLPLQIIVYISTNHSPVRYCTAQLL